MVGFFEDYEIGQVRRFGAYPVTRDEVIDFASRYDPQPFHLDDAAAAANPIFGRLSASGWHTAAMVMRMMVDEGQRTGSFSMGSPGLDEMRWLKPVYPGDTLSVETEVIDKSAPKSRPEIGFVKFRITCFNQHGEQVMRQIASNIQPRRAAAG
ncbi:Acyl dehydratase [Sphingomonas laterariae]|uniref:Acyl dehydratase n=1 Tax=Edaphosphingomonas laterariae TaxID=861865 RepID=A0A239I6C8_9SPHN|nr:MaoC family dehydratase [Sphingomonas laterariae]SNS89041.1 Acyl dehydratase [Sphingomonas laterariae]